MQQQSKDCDYAAVRYVLTAPLIAQRTARHIGKDDFNFVGLEQERETMSGGEAVLVRIAHELWTAKRVVGLSELVQRLDTRNFERVIDALKIARGSYSWDRVEAFLAGQAEELAA